MRYPLPWFPLSDDPRRCSCRTKPDCHPYRSSRAVYRFGRSGSSGFVGGSRRLRLSNCVPVPRVHSCRDRYRYRYICRPTGLLAVDGCRLERIRLLLRSSLKNRNLVRTAHILPLDCRFHAGYGLLRLLYIHDATPVY